MLRTLHTLAMFKPKPIPPKPGQESVWDYPRPPRLEPVSKHIVIELGGIKIAETRRAYRVLETSHAPVYYIPLEDVKQDVLGHSSNTSACEWKGSARYFSLHVGGKIVKDAAWFYPDPTPAFAPIKDYLAFYAHHMDACYVDGELVKPQPGNFYGGWITADVVGPFKGEPGSWGW
jgi:uncharacterized protein (DUF427 family)